MQRYRLSSHLLLCMAPPAPLTHLSLSMAPPAYAYIQTVFVFYPKP